MSNEVVERQNELFTLTDNFKQALDDWQADDTLLGIPIGGAFWVAADRLIAAFTDGLLPASCRRLAEAVSQFAPAWLVFRDQATVSNDPNAMPTTDAMKAAHAICEKRTLSIPKPPRRLESIQELKEQKVPDAQIALIKGWLHSDGSPDTDMVRAAMADPAKYDKLYRDDVADAKTQALLEADARTGAGVESKMARHEQLRNQKAHETAKQLIEQGLNVSQAADVLACSEDDVIQQCMAEGMELTEIYQQRGGALDMRPELSEEAQRSMAGQQNMAGRKYSPEKLAAEAEESLAKFNAVSPDLRARIVMAYEKDFAANQIANMYSLPLATVTDVLSEAGLLPPESSEAA